MSRKLILPAFLLALLAVGTTAVHAASLSHSSQTVYQEDEGQPKPGGEGGGGGED